MSLSAQDHTDVVPSDETSFDADDLDLIRITGHKPVLERNYNTFSLLAFSFTIVDAWAGIAGTLSTGIPSGGTAMLIYGTIGVTFSTTAVALSLAEISGAYPTSGGQYHWTAELSPPKYAAILSWFCGYFNISGWCVALAAVTVMLGKFIMGMVILCNPETAQKRWHGFISYQFFCVTFTAIAIFNRRNLPAFSKISLAVCIISFLVINITLLGSAPKNSAIFVFDTFTNDTGWKSNGIAFIVGLINPAGSFGGLDNSLHMAEEIKGARHSLPIVLVGTVAIGGVTMFITAITLAFCIQNLDEILSSPTGVAVLELFNQATENKGASVFLVFLLFYLLMAATIGALQSTNRLIWAFARDEALPYSDRFSKIHPKLKVPVNSALLCWAVLVILGFIYLASSTAFNALIGCNIVLMNISFGLPIGLMLFGRRKYMKPTTFPLGNVLGPVINAIALSWILFITIFFNFPFAMPANPSNMNYSSVILGIVTMFSAAFWFAKGRKTYKGPKMDVGMDRAFQAELVAISTSNNALKP